MDYLRTYSLGGDLMTGRNNKPDNTGPASHPSRLDQFGDKLAEGTKSKKNAAACGPAESEQSQR